MTRPAAELRTEPTTPLGWSRFGIQCTYVSSLMRSVLCRSSRCTSCGSTWLVISVVAKKCHSAWNPPCFLGQPAASRQPAHSRDQVRSVKGLPRVVVNSNGTVRRTGSPEVISIISTGVGGSPGRDRSAADPRTDQDRWFPMIRTSAHAGRHRRTPAARTATAEYRAAVRSPGRHTGCAPASIPNIPPNRQPWPAPSQTAARYPCQHGV